MGGKTLLVVSYVVLGEGYCRLSQTALTLSKASKSGFVFFPSSGILESLFRDLAFQKGFFVSVYLSKRVFSRDSKTIIGQSGWSQFMGHCRSTARTEICLYGCHLMLDG